MAAESGGAGWDSAVGGDLAARESAALVALAELAGGLPLALRIVGARLRARPHWTPYTMVRHLEDEQQRLDFLSHGELSVRDRLASVHAGLDPDEARLLRRLGALSGRRLPRWTAAVVLGEGWRRADELLERLAEAGLVDTSAAAGAGYFRWSDLVRLFAAERLRADEPGVETGVLRQVLEGWLCLAEHASRAVHHQDTPVAHPSSWRVPAECLTDVRDDPEQWLVRDREGMSGALARGRELGLEELCGALTSAVTALWGELYEGVQGEGGRGGWVGRMGWTA